MEIGRFSVKVQKLRRFYVRKSKKKISLSPAIVRQCPHKYGGKLGPLPLCFRAVSCLAQTAADASSPPWGSYDEFSIKPCSTSTTDEKSGCLFLPPPNATWAAKKRVLEDVRCFSSKLRLVDDARCQALSVPN